MLYNIEHSYYNNFKVYELNKLAPRAYFIPFENKKECDKTTYLTERYNSNQITLLNGEWDFAFYDKISDMPTQFNTDKITFRKTDVPSCWQMRGYEKPFYINARYMFDCHAPNVPADEGIMGKNTKIECDQKFVKVYNTVGVYRRQFEYDTASRAIISFLGVSSALQLYINGKFVGYSEGSHNTAEFDITAFVQTGVNEIVAVVYKWCNGTYLECQDMFRHNGIFRDVYITNYRDNYIFDYDIKTTKKANEQWGLSIAVKSVINDSNSKIEAILYDDNKEICTLNETNAFCASLDGIELWSAEIPKLYNLYIYIKSNDKIIYCVRQEVGFKEIEIDGNVFKFNDKAIKIKGVNHHDTHPKNGYSMTIEELEKEAILMKELNINCVRTSHYPPDPIFLKVANHYGLYIIDEADIETHGTGCKKFFQPNLISNKKAWKNHYWDRVARMYYRDRNNVCVTMWSLGNEAGGWRNQDYCYEMLTAIDHSIPIQYEGVCRTPRFAYDVISKMYDSTYFYEKYIAGKAPKRFYRAPYFQCEFAHAMGVGAGGLDYYVNLFLKADSIMGGCIWEWADHAILHDDGSYTYGGDHGEYAHDGNFCTDGMVYADRSFGSGSYNAQAAYRPIRASYISNNRYLLTNTNYFRDSSYLQIEWKYLCTGNVVAQGNIEDIIPPNSSLQVNIKHPALDTAQDCFINFVYTDKVTGKFVAEEQLGLYQYIPSNNVVAEGAINCIEENNLLKLDIKDGEIVFDINKGIIKSYCVGDTKIMQGIVGFAPTIFRVPIDNYRNIINKWKKRGLHNADIVLNKFDSMKMHNSVKIVATYNIMLNGKLSMKSTIIYHVHSNGVIEVDTTLNLSDYLDIPKYGLTMQLPNVYEHIEYYGLGNKENYSDFNAHATVGIFNTDSKSMYEPNIKPQDSGNRSQTRWVRLVDNDGVGIEIKAVKRAFDFNVLPFDDTELNRAKHNHELQINSDYIFLKVDGFVRGIGSASCGEDTRNENINSSKSINYRFQISPIAKKQ